MTRLLPVGTELDFWNGRTFVSLVGFRFLNTKLLGLPIPFHRNFNEVNLRFYVRRRTAEGWRRGVVFVKEIVPLPAVALIARRVYNENYITLPMRHRIELPQPSNGRARVTGVFVEVANGNGLKCLRRSLEIQVHFPRAQKRNSSLSITGVTRLNGMAARSNTVLNTPAWAHLYGGRSPGRLHGDVDSLYGPDYADILSRAPSSAFVVDGSAIVVRKGSRL